ncbi:aminoacyl-tRNA hydrolase [Chondromyces apiculatus]|uniref:Peptidyl-tRNA hydrolase n=1 Tax=Chondromyces apiculatus DSM 436 TaxID=1192034 RepID=A0A017T617_9BACT|nr:aminoacyl-tRNA hydrolase [Chondromyces apiculatus]EYF04235.1 Peptidyl-tRNA hydrolase [Chondromyces apiculatus DSM 436]
MHLVVGLGNPGKEYASHRHNIGFMAIDALAEEMRSGAFQDGFSGQFSRMETAGEKAILLKPATYMNESGRSVQAAMAFFKIQPEGLLVIHDELDLPFGDVRLKMGGGHAGHNGLRSIMTHLGNGEFCRVRMGIGRPPADFRGKVADYVLSGFNEAERGALPACVRLATQGVLDVIARGAEAAMNIHNTRHKRETGVSRA